MIICDKELKDLKIKLDSDRKDMEVKKEILKKVERLHEIREVWLQHMIQSIHLENENYKIKGTGLGLAIVKHIVIRHRGNITVNSNGNDGTTFMVYLPVFEGQ